MWSSYGVLLQQSLWCCGLRMSASSHHVELESSERCHSTSSYSSQTFSQPLHQSILWCGLLIGLRAVYYRLRSRGDNTFGSIHVCVSVRLSMGALLFEPFDLDFWHEGWPWPWLAWDFMSKVKVKQCVCLRSPVWTSVAEQVDVRTRLAEFNQW